MGQARGERGGVREGREKARMGGMVRTGVFQTSRTLEDDENEEVVMETMFSFEAFEMLDVTRIIDCALLCRNSQIPRSRRPCLLTSPDTMNSNLKRIANCYIGKLHERRPRGYCLTYVFQLLSHHPRTRH